MSTEGPRPLYENEFPLLVQFLNKQLRSEVDWSIEKEYPTALTHANLHNIRIIKESDHVVSHALMRPFLVRTPLGLLKVAGIGSVVTSTEHRNKGLSRSLIEDCLSVAQQHGCDFCILWTNIYDFYRKMNFELCGSELSLTMDSPIPPESLQQIKSNKSTLSPSSMTIRVLDTAQIDSQAFLRLYQQHSVYVLRSKNEIDQYLQIPNSKVYTAWSPSQQLLAYAVEGKGADLTAYIHEWGGGVHALLHLFAEIRQRQSRPITIISPAHSQNLVRQLAALPGVRLHEGFLGMIRIINYDSFCAKLKKYSLTLGIKDLNIQNQDNQIQFSIGGNQLPILSAADTIRLIFGPQRASQLQLFTSEHNQVLEKIFPIPFWIWGWDSV